MVDVSVTLMAATWLICVYIYFVLGYLYLRGFVLFFEPNFHVNTLLSISEACTLYIVHACTII